MLQEEVGLGFRRQMAQEILKHDQSVFSFVELAPENWMQIGGKYKNLLDEVFAKYKLFCHGLSLSLGSPEPLDLSFIKSLKHFFSEYPVEVYSEHLSYNKCDNAHLYDLLPIPFTKDAILHVVDRIKYVQDALDRNLAIENVSYYTPVDPEMSEGEFLSEIVRLSDCEILLDVNNVYVNAFNHKYDAKEFISSLPLKEVSYIHMAGHEQEREDLIIDTHGKAIVDPVYELLEWTLCKTGPLPVLIERDYDIPPFEELCREGKRVSEIQRSCRGIAYAS
ncbi:UPF0276 protein Shew_2240 [Chlamydiales bacterium SCGC AB-751-O23]|jgi:uncharacterized protein|nr:UPF0276 protein Shew_2240 [Chlamydiales bacterium SCGC AB-751-O23]